MRAVGVKELKNKLSEYLRIVKDGEVVLVTEHGSVIAQLARPPRYLGPSQETADQALERLAETGAIRLAEPSAMPSATSSLQRKPTRKIDLASALEALRSDRDR